MLLDNQLTFDPYLIDMVYRGACANLITARCPGAMAAKQAQKSPLNLAFRQTKQNLDATLKNLNCTAVFLTEKRPFIQTATHVQSFFLSSNIKY